VLNLLLIAVTIVACGKAGDLKHTEASNLFSETYLNESESKTDVTQTMAATFSPPKETKTLTIEKPGTSLVKTTPAPQETKYKQIIPTTVIKTATLTLTEILPGVPVHILSPGEGSKVISPIEMMFFLDVKPENPIITELYGSKGQMLVRHVHLVDVEHDKPTYTLFVPYELSTNSEFGRLSIVLKDEYGRYEHIHSVDLLLGNEGYAQLNAANINPVITITQPSGKDIIEGGLLIITGEVCLEITEPLRVILVDENGKVVGQRLAAVDSSDHFGCPIFTSEVPYIVEEQTSVRLMVYKEGSPLSDFDHLSSLLIVLKP